MKRRKSTVRLSTEQYGKLIEDRERLYLLRLLLTDIDDLIVSYTGTAQGWRTIADESESALDQRYYKGMADGTDAIVSYLRGRIETFKIGQRVSRHEREVWRRALMGED